MTGNVWEWVEDDWHDNYEGAPDNGFAWIEDPRGPKHVVRGGSFASFGGGNYTTKRVGPKSNIHNNITGFRLAKSVDIWCFRPWLNNPFSHKKNAPTVPEK